MQPRFDFVFSYWIFIWFLLYHFQIVSYNPKAGLAIALFTNVLMLFLMISYKNSLHYILLFSLIQMCIKILPLWSLRNTTIHNKDIMATIILFVIYNIWLAMNNENMVHLSEIGYEAVKYNKINTPIIYWIDKLLIQHPK
jgi:hypothetical protein